MSKPCVILLLLLLISSSCTITKRVHRKGWHVEWRHFDKKTDAETKTAQSKSISSFNEKSVPLMSTEENQRERISALRPVLQDEIDYSNVRYRTIQTLADPFLQPSDTTDSVKLTPFPGLSESRAYPTRKSRKNGRRTGFSSAVIFLLLGLLSALIALYLYSTLGAIASLMGAFLSVIGMIFLGIMGICFVIIGFVVLATAINGG
ncbi:MAG: hypothetical protein ACI837_000169 [Crocinitomicaceae bacterium]|jgi:hypothetical protein